MRLLYLFVLIGAAALAQSDRGSITGTISDPTQAVVAYASLHLTNSETGGVYEVSSSATGNFTFSQLPAGRYEFTVSVPGFKTYVHQNLSLQVAQTIREDVVLEIGAPSESVTVTAGSSLLKTESAELSTNTTSARLNALPILGIGLQASGPHGIRNPLAATTLSPGVYFVPNQILRVNGAPSSTFGIRVDGQDSTNGVVTFAPAQTQPSVEALDEVSLQSSNYAAEYGQASGGLILYTTKSGTNDWHGSAYDYWVNEALWAHQPYNFIRNQQHRHDYGITLGGPVSIPKLYNGRDRTFFFFGYEEYRESIVVRNRIILVPTPAYRQGDFATVLTGRAVPGAAGTDGLGNKLMEGMIFDPRTETLAPDGTRARLQFPDNRIPTSRFDAPAAKIQNLIPAPNFGSSAALINNFNNPFLSRRVTPIPSLKLDHSFHSRLKASFYWSTTETGVRYCSPQCGSEGLPDPITVTRGTFIESYTLRASVDYTLTPAVLLHAGTGFLSNDFKDTAPVTNYDLERELGIRGATAGREGTFPNIVMVGNQTRGGMSTMGPIAQTRTREAKPTGNISLTWVRNNHTTKLGAEIRLEGYPQASFTGTTGKFQFLPNYTSNSSLQGQNTGGAFVGFPYASFLLGGPTVVDLSQPYQTRGGRQFWTLFLQDNWKATRKLTLDYGLRWDYFTYPREQHGRTPAFDPYLANPGAGGHPGATTFEATCGCRYADNYPYALSPRLGAAYQIGSRTVLRAGFGANYSMTQGGAQGATGAGLTSTNPNFADPAMILSQGFPITPVWPNFDAGAFLSPGSITTGPSVVDSNYGRPARQWQWNMGVQREIARDLVVEASYVANRGVWWRSAALVDYNALTPESLAGFGLDWSNSEADRNILVRSVSSPLAGRFRDRIPYAGFPTGASVAQSLRPFPHFGSLPPTGAPLGKSWYDSLQVKVTKRYSHGFDFSYAYTFSKELQLGAETDGGGGVINDVFNRDTNKQLSTFSRPHWMALAASYLIPRWGNRWIDMVAADWTVAAVLQYGSGTPILIPGNITNNNGSTLLRSTRAVRVPGEPLFLTDLNCHCFDPSQTIVLNSAAWVDTPNGQWSPSAAYYNDFRYQRRPQEAMNLGRVFRIKERATLMVRVEFTNVFNRTQIPNPITSRGATLNRSADGRNVSGYGVIDTTGGDLAGQRQGTAVLRLQF